MSNITQTENGANSLKTSGNIIVDYYMMLSRNLNKKLNEKYLEECWKNDPYKTIAIIFNGRDRINGKKEKCISNICMLWLRRNKPETYKLNIMNYINKYGCWKDLLYISYNLNKNELVSKNYELNLFANTLFEDKINLMNDKSISLCAKWAPSENDRNDKRKHFAYKIASILYSKDDNYKMEKYRIEFLVPLRNKIQITETMMCNKEWDKISYPNVPSIASKKYLKAFMKHDSVRYSKYLEDVRNGKKKINITGILPHELLNFYFTNDKENETIELQWKTIIENIRSSGLLKNAIPIIDMSGSMFSASNGDIPARCAISLGILISLCCEGNFHKKLITFSETPTIINLNTDSLFECYKQLLKIPAGYNTNFISCAELIINLGKMFNISNENMPKKIIVLTDMQFDKVTDNPYDLNTTYEHIVKLYKENNYTPAKFIFWNLNTDHNETFPVNCDIEGTAMISGFSEQLLKIFMNYDDFNPSIIVEEILKPYIIDIIINDDEK
jgi:hypothetical protein